MKQIENFIKESIFDISDEDITNKSIYNDEAKNIFKTLQKNYKRGDETIFDAVNRLPDKYVKD